MLSRRRPLLKLRRQGKPFPLAKNWKRKLDQLAREVVMLRDSYQCQRCPGGCGPIQCCHIRSRRYLSTRWSLWNLIAMGAGCHMHAHHNPLEFAEWFAANYPDRANLVRLSNHRGHKIEPNLIWLGLMDEKRKLEAAR